MADLPFSVLVHAQQVDSSDIAFGRGHYSAFLLARFGDLVKRWVEMDTRLLDRLDVRAAGVLATLGKLLQCLLLPLLVLLEGGVPEEHCVCAPDVRCEAAGKLKQRRNDRCEIGFKVVASVVLEVFLLYFLKNFRVEREQLEGEFVLVGSVGYLELLWVV